MRTLSAPAIVLEPLTAAHAHEMFAVLRDPAIYEFEGEPPQSEDALFRRYTLLETRRSKDGSQTWLNWVIRLSSGEPAGYVQATVQSTGSALIAYELSSRHWRKGIGSAALTAMLDELRASYQVSVFVAVLKTRNYRSLGLLRKLGFHTATDSESALYPRESGETVMVKSP